MPPPASLATVYATDEDVFNIAGADFKVLANLSFMAAQGTDGVFAAGKLWTLTSPSNLFKSQGVVSNMLVQLTGPATTFRGGGQLLAVDSADDATGLVLRRPGKPLNWGMPPAPIGGLTGVSFLITTLQVQLDDVSYKLNERLSIDPLIPNRTPGDAYDLRVIKAATVYMVLARLYANQTRTDGGDFEKKAVRYQQMYDDEIDQAKLRWGPTGQSQPSTTVFSTRIAR
jgi:hypothetical protein